MPEKSGLSIAEVKSAFAEEIIAQDGRVTDAYDDEIRLFTRSILPRIAEVRPKDKLQGDVALKALGQKV